MFICVAHYRRTAIAIDIAKKGKAYESLKYLYVELLVVETGRLEIKKRGKRFVKPSK